MKTANMSYAKTSCTRSVVRTAVMNQAHQAHQARALKESSAWKTGRKNNAIIGVSGMARVKSSINAIGISLSVTTSTLNQAQAQAHQAHQAQTLIMRIACGTGSSAIAMITVSGPTERATSINAITISLAVRMSTLIQAHQAHQAHQAQTLIMRIACGTGSTTNAKSTVTGPTERATSINAITISLTVTTSIMI